MKRYILAAIFTAICACQIEKPKPCPTPVDVPPCPMVSVTPCPEATPCPQCPNCPVCPEPTPCPTPTAPPVYPDVPHPVGDFEVVAVLAAKDTLGLYISDPNGVYNSAIFPMPELDQKIEFEEILTLDLSKGDNGPDELLPPISVDIGTTEGSVDKFGLIVSVLCDREFKNYCTANVTSNGNDLTSLQIDTFTPAQSFVWQKK